MKDQCFYRQQQRTDMMRFGYHIQRLIMLPLLGVLSSVFVSYCGAPTKSASDVTEIFEKDESLGGKVYALCANLSQRQLAPNLSRLEHITADACKGAGRNAQHVNNLISGQEQGIKFVGFSTDSINGNSDPVFEIKTRIELWLNRSIVGMVTMFASSMQGMASSSAPGAELDIFGPTTTATGTNTSSETSTSTTASTQGMQSVQDAGIYPKAVFKESPTFNKETGEFHMAINISTTGSLTINNDFYIDGGVYNGAIAVSVETREDLPFERSLMKSLKVLALVVPYDSDIYIDLSINMNLNSIGVNTIYEKQIRAMLENLAKIVVDKLKEMDEKK